MAIPKNRTDCKKTQKQALLEHTAVMQTAVMQAAVRKHQMSMAAEETVPSSSYYLKAEKVDCRMTWKALPAAGLAGQKRMKMLV